MTKYHHRTTNTSGKLDRASQRCVQDMLTIRQSAFPEGTSLDTGDFLNGGAALAETVHGILRTMPKNVREAVLERNMKQVEQMERGNAAWQIAATIEPWVLPSVEFIAAPDVSF